MTRTSAKSVGRAAVVAVSTAVISSLMVGSAAQAEPKVTRNDVEKAFDQAEAANEVVNQLEEDQKVLDRRINEIKAELSSIGKVHRMQRDELGATIVQQHLEQPLGPTVGLLASQDPDMFIEGLSAIDALNTTRADALTSFERTQRSLDKREKQLAEHLDGLNESKAEADKTRQKMQSAYRKATSDFERLKPTVQAKMNTSDTKPVSNTGSGAGKSAIAFAMSQLGKPYGYGSTGPGAYDCSGLVLKAYGSAGVSLPRVVGPQMAAGRRISKGELKPGDLVAYPSMAHIGIYLGDGKVIHSPRPGKTVEITSLSYGFGVFTRVAG